MKKADLRPASPRECQRVTFQTWPGRDRLQTTRRAKPAHLDDGALAFRPFRRRHEGSSCEGRPARPRSIREARSRRLVRWLARRDSLDFSEALAGRLAPNK